MADELVQAFHECWLTYNHLLDVLFLDTLGIGQFLEGDVGIVRLELLQCHLVVVGLRVAQLGAALGNEGQRWSRCGRWRHASGQPASVKSKELEHAHDVLLYASRMAR